MGEEEKALGKRLSEARRKAGLTQQELCHKAGLSYSTLAKIERGAIKSPSVFTVASIARATGESLDEMMQLNGHRGGKRTSKTGVKFVYFDVGEVLMGNLNAVFAKVAADHLVPMDAFENVFWRYRGEAETGKITIEAFNKKLAADLGIGSIDWVKYYSGTVKPTKEAQDLLAWAKTNYRVGLLTNQTPGVFDQLVSRQILDVDGIDEIVMSCNVGYIKPQPEIYKIAQEKAGVRAHEILFIDNDRHNLTPADKAGWQVQWFNDLDPAGSVKKIREKLEF